MKRHPLKRRRHRLRCAVCGMVRRSDRLVRVSITPHLYDGPFKLACKTKKGRTCEAIVLAMRGLA
jgi:hypothetical protein